MCPYEEKIPISFQCSCSPSRLVVEWAVCIDFKIKAYFAQGQDFSRMMGPRYLSFVYPKCLGKCKGEALVT